jgi:hypothetical protein
MTITSARQPFLSCDSFSLAQHQEPAATRAAHAPVTLGGA